MEQAIKADNLDEPIVRHLRRDFTAVRADQTVGEALASARSTQLAEKIIYFYVIDADGKLVGVVPTRRLLMSQPDVKIESIMVRDVISVPARASVLDACEFFVMHRLLAFPVVDEQNQLIGVVDVSMFTEEMFGVSERQSAEDVFQLIGVRQALARQGSPLDRFRARFPWLLCNIGGGIACAFIAGFYQAFLDTVVVLALFIPVVLALAESVSIQSMTITLQGFHARRPQWAMTFQSLRREFVTAFLLGVASGAMVGLVALVWKRDPAVALAIAATICLSIVTACLLGVLLPTMVYAFRGDPKIAAGPVVLATADIATLLFYFNVAGIMLGGVRS